MKNLVMATVTAVTLATSALAQQAPVDVCRVEEDAAKAIFRDILRMGDENRSFSDIMETHVDRPQVVMDANDYFMEPLINWALSRGDEVSTEEMVNSFGVKVAVQCFRKALSHATDGDPAGFPISPRPQPRPTSRLGDVAAAARAAADTAEARGPEESAPMTETERQALLASVQRCWNVDPGSDSAQVEITVAFRLDRSGRVDGDIRQLPSSGGTDAAKRGAYDAARRAILRCQGDGFPLPAKKYDQWQEVELIFDVSGMRLR